MKSFDTQLPVSDTNQPPEIDKVVLLINILHSAYQLGFLCYEDEKKDKVVWFSCEWANIEDGKLIPDGCMEHIETERCYWSELPTP